MRRAAGLRRERGMTIIETAVAATIGVMALGAGAALSNSSLRDSNTMFVRSSLSIRSAEATEKIVRDLQIATLTGEDVNRNAALDSTEDVNRNGRLDADWNLADGGIASTITFNQLRDGWLWSSPVTYSLSGGRVIRTQDGVERVLCTGVQSMQFLRSGDLVDVTLTLAAADRAGQTWTEVSKRRAHVRN